MQFLKCNHCGHLNEIKSEYLVFCSNCNKKLDNNFSNWKKRYPEKTFEDFKQLMCTSENEALKNKATSYPGKQKNKKLWLIPVIIISVIIIGVVGRFVGYKLYEQFKTPVINKVMVEFSNQINKNCPIIVDNATRLDNSNVLPNNEFQYNYTIYATVKDSINIEQLKNFLEPNIINNIKTDPQMKFFRDNKTTLNYSYKDRKGEYLLTITVKPQQYE